MSFVRAAVLRAALVITGMAAASGSGGTVFAQHVRVSEIVASNTASLLDADGDAPDWIELHNAGTEPAALGGYGLSDDPDDPFRWTLPEMTLAPGAFVVVFASGKDRPAVHWESVVDAGDAWRYRHEETPPRAWTSVAFDDGAWPAGPSGFGYGDGDDATTLPAGTRAVFTRTAFDVADPAAVERALLHIDYDDAFVAFVNGTEVARAGIGGTAPGVGDFASSDHEARRYRGLPLDAFEVPAERFREGRNVLAVQVHNVSASSSDLSLLPVLSLALPAPPGGARGPSDLAPGLAAARPHASFSLDADGERVVLTAPDGTRLDDVAYPPLPPDVSYARPAADPERWALYTDPTPGAPNEGAGYTGRVAAPVFDVAPGRHPAGTLHVPISAPDADARIHYTLDGSVPTPDAPRYDAPPALSETSVVRARAFRDGALPSDVLTATFLIGEPTALPVLALVAEPMDLWSDERGIYVLGPNADTQNPHFGANFWQDWEIPVHLALHEPGEAAPALSMDAGARIFGGWSRAHAQKSLAVYARGRYGADVIDYPLFPDRPQRTYESFVLRNGGNDWHYTLFRDALIQSLAGDAGVDVLAYRPVAVYLNGEYWGIQNLREKISEHYPAGRHGVDPDAVDLLEIGSPSERYRVLHGSDAHLRSLLDYVGTRSMTSEADFAVVDSMIDVDAFIDYHAAQIYAANTDWPGNNVKLWRPNAPGGRWRWILYDTDFGFGIYDDEAYRHRTLAFATASDGPAWPNPPHSTFLLRRLLLNPTFQTAFVNRFADHLNETFAPAKVVNRIDAFAAAIDDEVPRHNARWGGTLSDWDREVDRMQAFAVRRPARMLSELRMTFGLAEPRNVTVAVEGRGTVRVNGLRIDAFPWAGAYFPGVPVPLHAVPARGYRFDGWSGGSDATEALIHVDPADRPVLVARFVPDAGVRPGVILNEVMYNAADDRPSGDWVELHNAGSEPAPLGGWVLSDERDDHRYVVPSAVMVAPGGFVVLCETPSAFADAYPNAAACLGPTGFGLGAGGDAVRLFDADGALVDAVVYDDEAPWPAEADGGGASLERRRPAGDGRDVALWGASARPGGTPGAANSVAAVSAEASNAPRRLALHAPYPNPFADAVTLSYELDAPGPVVLRVYDVLGRAVRTLVDAPRAAGAHAVRFDARGLAGGLYVCRLESGGRTQSRTMLLVP